MTCDEKSKNKALMVFSKKTSFIILNLHIFYRHLGVPNFNLVTSEYPIRQHFPVDFSSQQKLSDYKNLSDMTNSDNPRFVTIH